MKSSKTLFWLSILVALLAATYAGVGLFSRGGEGSFTFTTLHGEEVEMYGKEIYRNDSAFKAPILRGTDAVTLFVCVPVLVAAGLFYRRDSLRGRVFLTGVLAYFLYNSASLGLSAAYNNLLLVYITCTSASLFAFVMAFRSIDLADLAGRTSKKIPRCGIAIFLFLAGMSLVVWLVDIIGGLVQGSVPANLGPYTTEATYTLDLGVLLPSIILTGVLVLRRSALGTLLAAVLITLNAIIGLVVASQTIMQVFAGVVLTPVVFAMYVIPFILLSLVAVGLLSTILRNIADPQ